MTEPKPAGAGESNRLHRDLATAVVSFHEAVARRLGMTAAERKCAGVLAERGRMTPGELAQETGLTTGAITGIVDRLAKAGYAARVPHPTDRRSVIVETAPDRYYLDVPEYDRWRRGLRRRLALLMGGISVAVLVGGLFA